MLKKICEKLDEWLIEENKLRHEDGTVLFKKVEIKVLGQTALIEANIELYLLATMDVDAYMNCEFEIRKKFDELLQEDGRHLDPDSKLVWMPEETKYQEFYLGKMLKVSLAQAEFVLLSKALKAPAKNKAIIVEYLAKGASPLFQKLAVKYELDLEQFL